MDLEAFLTDQLQNQSDYELTDTDQTLIENEGIDSFRETYDQKIPTLGVG